MTELKMCPFCGQQNDMDFTNVTTPLFEWDRVELRHTNCLASIRGYSVDEVIHNWNTRPIEDELNARIAQLTAERDAWRKDAERLAKNHLSITKANQFVCSYCGYLTQDDDGIIVHQDTCPITLHRELVAKYGGENNQANVCSGGENVRT